VSDWVPLVAGVGSGLVAGFYLAFSVVVMPALRHRPAQEAAAAMVAVNAHAVRAPFMVLFFGTAAACAATAVMALGGASSSGFAGLVGSLAHLAGWVLTMVVNVPLNTRLARSAPGAGAWTAFAPAWTRANHARTALSLVGAVALLQPLPG
jgi:uncharacterized membrane protein